MDFACSVKKRILRLSEWSFKCWQQHRKYCAHTHTHTHTYTPTRNMHSCMHVHMHAHTHLHACRHSRAHKHTRTLTYICPDLYSILFGCGQIRSGQEANSLLLGRYCNASSPAPVTTIGPYAYVYFHTDSSLSDRGFHITYSAVSGGWDLSCNLPSFFLPLWMSQTLHFPRDQSTFSAAVLTMTVEMCSCTCIRNILSKGGQICREGLQTTVKGCLRLIWLVQCFSYVYIIVGGLLFSHFYTAHILNCGWP